MRRNLSMCNEDLISLLRKLINHKLSRIFCPQDPEFLVTRELPLSSVVWGQPQLCAGLGPLFCPHCHPASQLACTGTSAVTGFLSPRACSALGVLKNGVLMLPPSFCLTGEFCVCD